MVYLDEKGAWDDPARPHEKGEEPLGIQDWEGGRNQYMKRLRGGIHCPDHRCAEDIRMDQIE